MGCRKASPTTLLVVILAVVFLLTLDRPVAHARHLRSPPASTAAEHSSRQEGSQRTRSHGVEHTKNTETVRAEKGSTGEAGAAGASVVVVGRRGNSPAAASAEKVVVARYGPRPHPKKHN